LGQFLQSMTWPFLACLVLTGIHVYLGIHVLARKVIFVDLALAQIAALGTVWGVLLGWDVHEDPWQIKGFSLAFAVLGAAVFSLTRMRRERVPQEAVIGITYAVALAATILLSANLAHGAEEVRDLLTGSILWVRADQVLWTALLYAGLGVFHWVFRHRFLALSLDHEAAEAQGLDTRLWDFLFYVTFGFVVTSSVAIAGVLLVFSYLVIPAAVGVLFADSIRARLAIGWLVGTLVSLFGVSLSYFRDLPSGPTIVVSFGGFLALAGAGHHLAHAERRGRAFLRVLAGALVLCGLVVGSRGLRKTEDLDLRHLLEEGTLGERLLVIARAEAQPETWNHIDDLLPALFESGEPELQRRLLELVARRDAVEFLDQVHALLQSEDEILREEAIRTVRHFDLPTSAPALLAAAQRETDDYIRVELGEALLELGERSGAEILFDVLASDAPRGARRDAYEHLAAHVDLETPYDPQADARTRQDQVQALRKWWEARPELEPHHAQDPVR
jgi:zinc/manganese transport system permease protein